MVILQIVIAAICMLSAPHRADAANESNRYKLVAGMDVSFINASGHSSWTEGSVGKLLYDDNNENLKISHAFADISFQATDTLTARAVLNAYDDIGPVVGFTQAYVEWRPVPKSSNRYRLKVGAFYPHLSLENVSAGWTSPYSTSFSAINTWVAEELRTIGAELSVSRRPETLGGAHIFSFHGAVFAANDPTGSLLAWKGWSAHFRQSRFGDKLPLPPLPLIQPGMMFEAQDPYVDPFREIDNHAGFYLGGEWRFNQQLMIRVMHYDNRADPTVLEGGQYAWRTKFEHVAAMAALPEHWDVLFQWMTGSTMMGPIIGNTHAVDTEFNSAYLMLTRTLDRHRMSIRYDQFEITQNDSTPEDNNPENGHILTLAYSYKWSDKVTFGAESLRIKTHRCAWEYYDLNPTLTEKQLQLSVRLQFGS